MKQKIITLLLVIPILGISLLTSCGKDNKETDYELPDDPIVEQDAFLMFSNYSSAPSLLKGINGKGTDVCITIISDKQPTATISKNWGVKCDFFKVPNEKDKWHCLLSFPKNDDKIQRHAILSIHNDNKTIKLKMNQNTSCNVESGWNFTSVDVDVDDDPCAFHSKQASNSPQVVSDPDDITTGSICSACNGTLKCQSCYSEPGTGECKYCKGRGTWTELIWTVVVKEYCNICNWTGKCISCIGYGICPKCYGLGIIDDSWNK